MTRSRISDNAINKVTGGSDSEYETYICLLCGWEVPLKYLEEAKNTECSAFVTTHLNHKFLTEKEYRDLEKKYGK